MVPHIKAPILSFLEREEYGLGIMMGAPCQIPVKMSINMKEIKVSHPIPNRVKLGTLQVSFSLHGLLLYETCLVYCQEIGEKF